MKVIKKEMRTSTRQSLTVSTVAGDSMAWKLFCRACVCVGGNEVLCGRIVVPSHIGLRSNLALEVALPRCNSLYIVTIRPLKGCLHRNLVWFTQFVISSISLRDRLSGVNKNMRALLIQFCNFPLWSLDKEVTRADTSYVFEIVDVMDGDCL